MRVDSTSLISGALVVGNRGLGVLGSSIPATGETGPGFLYNDLSLPADANKEVRGLILTTPSAGEFFANEDSSFTFVGAPDGLYSFSYRLYVDGVDSGTGTATLAVGSAVANLTGANSTQNNASSSGSISIGGAVTLTGSDCSQSNSCSQGAISIAGIYDYVEPVDAYRVFAANATKQTAAKDPSEIIPFTFDFSTVARGIISATVSVTVKAGVDANASSMLTGPAVIDATAQRVQQFISSGVAGVTYYMICHVEALNGNFSCVAIVPVTDAINR